MCFTSIRGWLETLQIKNCIKNLTVIMPSYFYKDSKDKAWKPSVKKTILAASHTHKPHIYRSLMFSLDWRNGYWSLELTLNEFKNWNSNLKNLKSKLKNARNSEEKIWKILILVQILQFLFYSFQFWSYIFWFVTGIFNFDFKFFCHIQPQCAGISIFYIR